MCLDLIYANNNNPSLAAFYYFDDSTSCTKRCRNDSGKSKINMHIRLVFRYLFCFLGMWFAAEICWNRVSVVSSSKKGYLVIRKCIVMYFITFCFQKMYFLSKLNPYFLEVKAETILVFIPFCLLAIGINYICERSLFE